MAGAAIPTSYLFASADSSPGQEEIHLETSADSSPAPGENHLEMAADSSPAPEENHLETEAPEGESRQESRDIVNENGERVMENETGRIAKQEQIGMEQYEPVAENENFILYFYEPRLSIAVKSKSGGKWMFSTLMDAEDDGHSNEFWNAQMKSGLNVTAIVGTAGDYPLDLISVPAEIRSAKIADGVEAKIRFPEYGLGLTVRISLDGNQLHVKIPKDSIIEEKEDHYFQTITLFPFMGYTHMDDQRGYMLVPDGNGALIDLDNKEGRFSSGFSQMVYGNDDGLSDRKNHARLWDRYEMVNEPYPVRAPVFGMAHLDDQFAYLGVIESGDRRAMIQSEPNGVFVNYNRTYARFLLRTVYQQPLDRRESKTVPVVENRGAETDLSVSYYLLTGEDAGYVGMAKAYRAYLLKNGQVKRQDAGYRCRVDFLGADRENFLFGTRAVTMTTVSDAEEKFDELRARGIHDLISVYKGWQKGGVYGLPISHYQADRHIGGTKALTEMIREQAQKGYRVYLYDEALSMNAEANPVTDHAVKKVNRRTLEVDTHQAVFDTFYYLMPEQSKNLLGSFTDEALREKVSSFALAGVTGKLFSYSREGEMYGRNDTAEQYEKMLQKLPENAELALEQPNEYLWKYAGVMLDMPVNSSAYQYIDAEIPFFSMVLKGILPMYSEYVNLQANKRDFFLRMAEAGVYPSFYLTAEDSSKLSDTNSNDLYSTEFETYGFIAAEFDKELRSLGEKINGACIADHEILGHGVRKVTYENGVIVYVNYSEESVTEDGVNLKAKSFELRKVR